MAPCRSRISFFREDIFAGLISLIFIIDGVLPIIRNFTDNQMSLTGAMFETLLFVYTFGDEAALDMLEAPELTTEPQNIT